MSETPLPHNRSMPACTIIPVLAYPDLEKAIDWLCSTFGFTERWRVGAHRAQLAFGDGAIAISAASGEAPNGTHSLMVRVPDVFSHYEHVSLHKAKLLHPPADYPYGERQYSVEDIGGHIWTFSQSIKDMAPEEWGGTSASR